MNRQDGVAKVCEKKVGAASRRIAGAGKRRDVASTFLLPDYELAVFASQRAGG